MNRTSGKILFFSILLSSLFFLMINLIQKELENFFTAQITQPFKETVFVKMPPKKEKPKLEIEAKSVLSIKIQKNGREKVLFEKDSQKILPIASLTKLMTAIIALENYDFETTSIISKRAAHQANAPHYGNLDKEVGKKFNLEQLLDLMLIYSSNDAAWALAEVIGVENFVKKMNEKARELGLENTHFVNPHGLDPENLSFEEFPENFNYSTAKDLVKVSQYILKEHPLIFEITKKEPFYLIENGIFDLFLTQEIIGGKTGYTDEAGGCILFIFKDNKENIFINLILGASSTSARIEEMQKLINWLNL